MFVLILKTVIFLRNHKFKKERYKFSVKSYLIFKFNFSVLLNIIACAFRRKSHRSGLPLTVNVPFTCISTLSSHCICHVLTHEQSGVHEIYARALNALEWEETSVKSCLLSSIVGDTRNHMRIKYYVCIWWRSCNGY